ncbi:MAG TPA: hypothetical protein VFW73_10070 [Lacipirellulaceae bacterium]|nr:hypothetical protein [Lacipirellulaceae bacterium]
MTNVARGHGDDGIRQSTIISIILNDERWTLFSASPIDEGKVNNDNVATIIVVIDVGIHGGFQPTRILCNSL